MQLYGYSCHICLGWKAGKIAKEIRWPFVPMYVSWFGALRCQSQVLYIYNRKILKNTQTQTDSGAEAEDALTNFSVFVGYVFGIFQAWNSFFNIRGRTRNNFSGGSELRNSYARFQFNFLLLRLYSTGRSLRRFCICQDDKDVLLLPNFSDRRLDFRRRGWEQPAHLHLRYARILKSAEPHKTSHFGGDGGPPHSSPRWQWQKQRRLRRCDDYGTLNRREA